MYYVELGLPIYSQPGKMGLSFGKHKGDIKWVTLKFMDLIFTSITASQ